MPKYFFHLALEDQVILDSEGRELCDLSAARRCAGSSRMTLAGCSKKTGKSGAGSLPERCKIAEAGSTIPWAESARSRFLRTPV
jgi:hypothetical protein